MIIVETVEKRKNLVTKFWAPSRTSKPPLTTWSPNFLSYFVEVKTLTFRC